MRRMQREDEIRRESGGRRGLSEVDMEAFWTNMLEPGIRRYVQPVAQLADLVIRFSDSGNIVGACRGR